MQTFIQATLIADLEAVIHLRHLLHQHLELSGHEEQAAKRIRAIDGVILALEQA